MEMGGWASMHGWVGHLFSHLSLSYVAFIQASCFPGMHFKGRKKEKVQQGYMETMQCK